MKSASDIIRISDLASAEEDIRRAMLKLKQAKAPMLVMLAQRLAGEVQMAVKKARASE